jgi:glycine/D-amino acid oxidase-like deaminating enzyme
MRVLTTDAVIVGGGAAGCYAALELSKKKIGSIIVCKGLVGKSGASIFAGNTPHPTSRASFARVGLPQGERERTSAAVADQPNLVPREPVSGAANSHAFQHDHHVGRGTLA